MLYYNLLATFSSLDEKARVVNVDLEAKYLEYQSELKLQLDP